MIKLLRNPISIWLYKLLGAMFLELKHKDKSLSIRASSIVKKSYFGEKNTIYKNVVLNNVTLGDFTYIANNTRISNATLGKFCSIGSDSQIGLGKHPSSIFVSTHPIFFSTAKQAQITFVEKNYFEEFEEVLIANDVWIGSNAIILDGVKIADGAVIAAGSVVTKDVPPYAIVAGVPAKVIKYRFDKDEIDQLLKLKWWDMDVKYLQKNYQKFHNIKSFLGSQD